jgi:hypothetical protein
MSKKATISITRSIRHGSKVFKPGMEEELASAATPEQLHRLTEMGMISGFEIKSKAAEAKPAAADKSEKSETGKDK